MTKLNRINIVGSSAVGKSTFARNLGKALGHPVIEMDQVFWKPYWTETPDEEFFPKIEKLIAGDKWILEGNFNRTKPIKWKNVETVIWLDMPFPLHLYQSLSRALKRGITKKEIWPGSECRESISKTFFSNDSIILWMLKNYKGIRKRYLADMNDPQYAHINFVRLRSRKEIKTFLESAKEFS